MPTSMLSACVSEVHALAVFGPNDLRSSGAANTAVTKQGLQGIPWDRLPLERAKYRQDRVKQYQNYFNASKALYTKHGSLPEFLKQGAQHPASRLVAFVQVHWHSASKSASVTAWHKTAFLCRLSHALCVWQIFVAGTFEL